jgi:hypothetical protein
LLLPLVLVGKTELGEKPTSEQQARGVS